jgi:hypothetical protein
MSPAASTIFLVGGRNFLGIKVVGLTIQGKGIMLTPQGRNVVKAEASPCVPPVGPRRTRSVEDKAEVSTPQQRSVRE